MLVAVIILAVLVFFALCGLVSISSALEVIAKNQVEVIRVLKNSK